MHGMHAENPRPRTPHQERSSQLGLPVSFWILIPLAPTDDEREPS